MKTETKHTKGEWKIRKAIAMPSKSGSIEIFSNNIIAVGINAESDEDFMAVAFCGNFQNEQALANAKLIAAAPELLEALKNLLNTCPCDFDTTTEFYEANQRAIDAIKQATE
jgi:hypothetical protein